ncbi:hypothetical protein K466DRAFT_374444 [Polyporus arcularius HHB13444]|uniref:Uncharacterized protein n=1 Tax=Polyporus arcularius HHB13444 TaxID=1314778 RepID=A0A5C3PMR9_9APHY|nr:hypothetical protein K466DRAFT_374444 [Polyporus arcularius HHB13444]
MTRTTTACSLFPPSPTRTLLLSAAEHYLPLSPDPVAAAAHILYARAHLRYQNIPTVSSQVPGEWKSSCVPTSLLSKSRSYVITIATSSSHMHPATSTRTPGSVHVICTVSVLPLTLLLPLDSSRSRVPPLPLPRPRPLDWPVGGPFNLALSGQHGWCP